jgi:ubiquinone/menaquinone biosynthesis C-methylase UbiE
MKSSEFQHKIQETHEQVAGQYSQVPEGRRVEKVRRLFAEFPGRQKALDIGCGNGGILAPFATAHEIHGVELYGPLVPVAVKNGLRAVEHDLEGGPLPYADSTFDVVFCGETIEHQVDTDGLLAEINRVLKPGGQLILTYPNIRTLLSLVMMVFDMPPMYAARYRAPHFRDFTLKTIRIALRQHSFAIERAIGSAFYVPKLGDCCSALATVLPSWASTVIVVARKLKNSDYDPAAPLDCQIY